MGSGGSRKANDVVIINRPISKGGGAGGSADGGSRSQDTNEICPPAFEVRIKPERKLPDGVAVVVDGEALKVLGQPVGTLSAVEMERMEECAGLGIRYTGQVVNKPNEKVYAHFEQS